MKHSKWLNGDLKPEYKKTTNRITTSSTTEKKKKKKKKKKNTQFSRPQQGTHSARHELQTQ